MESLVIHGLYKVKDQYFDDFKRDYWNDNKNENRPYYFLWRDTDGIAWLIPISSQAENYKAKIRREEAKRGKGNCIYYQIGLIAGTEHAFLIGDMFPVDEGYIKAPFTFSSIHYVSRDTKLNSQIYSKAMRYMKLIEQGKIISRNDIMGIKQILLNRKENQDYMI